MKEIFGNDLYVEIQPHDFKEQVIGNLRLIDIAQSHKIKIIASAFGKSAATSLLVQSA